MGNTPGGEQKPVRIFIINKRVIVSFVLLIAVVLLITSNQFWRWMYPIEYQPVIQDTANRAQVDPLLVASVIRVESKFNSEDVSHAGAVGLMQLMPGTALWVAQMMHSNGDDLRYAKGDSLKQLANPQVNIEIGSWYIHYLIRQFNGNRVAAVAAYNGGPKRVGEWLSNGTWDGRLNTIGRIPVGETRHFVDRVFYNYDLYKRIYGADKRWQAAAQ
jgi:soluble lytic murein transglycosylase